MSLSVADAAAAADTLSEVAPDVLRLTLPLDEGIDHVNVYLLRDGDGWLLFDTGADTAATRASWERALAGGLAGGLTRIIVSHHHPDHLGLAAWLQQRTGATVYLRPEERTSAIETALPTPEAMRGCQRYFRDHGMAADDAAEITENLLQRFMACDIGFVSQTLHDGEVLQVGSRSLRALVQGGHSVAQICLYEPETGMLLTGDQLLERITPNLSLLPWGDRQPLHHYLQSLEQIAELDLRLVLPAHHRVYHAGAARACGLIRHHERALKRFVACLRPGMTGTEVATAVYGRRHHVLDRFLALTETLAHLQYLQARGKAREDAGFLWYPIASQREGDPAPGSSIKQEMDL